MPDAVRRLAREDEPAIEHLITADPVPNLFLIGFLAVHPVERTWWYGAGDPVRAVVLVLPGRLAVPFALDPAEAEPLGAHLRHQHAPCLVVGPRAVTDTMWRRWATEPARRFYDQRLYELEIPPSGDDPPGFRLGKVTDAPRVAPQAAAMELEDLGVDPSRGDAVAHEAAVADRLRCGRTWVIERGGQVVFQVNLGTTHAVGCQVGGTFVPPAHRGAGLATAGVSATARALLARYSRITLHVNEANTPAVRAYERAGFAARDAFRLIVP
ncbi:MAG: GNAT family N-acetyltransferase [Myxococcota bacterium]